MRSPAAPLASFPYRRSSSDVAALSQRTPADNASLYNTSHASLPLLIYIPSFPTPEPSPDCLPPFLRRYPVAMIHYRWSPTSPIPTPFHWPTPLHDVSFAYAHLSESLAPPLPSRRSIFVLSSHLGASLATSLALTESHPHKPFSVRGLAVHNGIYNWTMLLPGHRAHKPKKAGGPPADVYQHACDAMREMGGLMPGLFKRTDKLFDPFASASLFFRTSGMDIPSSFTRSEDLTSQIDRLSSLTEDDDGPLFKPAPPPRRAALVFPPRASTLKIPETHLLYTRPPPLTARKRRAKAKGNTFETQAAGLAEVMRRSVEREVKERMAWDDEVDEDAPNLRVQMHDVGEGDGRGMSAAEGFLAGWLEAKFGF